MSEFGKDRQIIPKKNWNPNHTKPLNTYNTVPLVTGTAQIGWGEKG